MLIAVYGGIPFDTRTSPPTINLDHQTLVDQSGHVGLQGEVHVVGVEADRLVGISARGRHVGRPDRELLDRVPQPRSAGDVPYRTGRLPERPVRVAGREFACDPGEPRSYGERLEPLPRDVGRARRVMRQHAPDEVHPPLPEELRGHADQLAGRLRATAPARLEPHPVLLEAVGMDVHVVVASSENDETFYLSTKRRSPTGLNLGTSRYCDWSVLPGTVPNWPNLLREK